MDPKLETRNLLYFAAELAMDIAIDMMETGRRDLERALAIPLYGRRTITKLLEDEKRKEKPDLKTVKRLEDHLEQSNDRDYIATRALVVKLLDATLVWARETGHPMK